MHIGKIGFFTTFMIIAIGCNTSTTGNNDVVTNNSGDCESAYFSDNFESYDVGLYELEPPWHESENRFEQVYAYVVNEGCAVGERCLKVHSPDVFEDPVFDAHIYADPGCYNSYPVVYSQFYIKYHRSDSSLEIYYRTRAYFFLYLPNQEVEVNNISPDTWYRIEIMLNHPDPGILNLKIYEGENIESITGSSNLENSTGHLAPEGEEISEGTIHFTYDSGYAPSDPSEASSGFPTDEFLFFLDDFAISNDPSILKVGF